MSGVRADEVGFEHQLADVVGRLDEYGYAIVDGLLTRDTATEIGVELRQLLDDVPTGRNYFEGFRTRRLYALFAKTRCLDPLALHPLILGALDHVLGAHYQLSGPTGIEIGPGEVEQVLHRDEDIYPVPRPHPQLVTNVMWAFDDFTAANGATRLIPGSHRTVDQPDPSTPIVRAEMPAGSAMIYIGSLWHGGGANQTNASRLGAAIEYAASWLRPQETQLLAVSPDQARTLPKRLRELLGYNIYPPFVGYVDGRHPERLLETPGAALPPP
ncbi:MAG TPA: phytanoyl-CoA dioxygenase family protein [Acidimicrobiia bacterium]|nr:phytanoyl-CoA dioxygenase family protein [Acidimicrobiia bacterium]